MNVIANGGKKIETTMFTSNNATKTIISSPNNNIMIPSPPLPPQVNDGNTEILPTYSFWISYNIKHKLIFFPNVSSKLRPQPGILLFRQLAFKDRPLDGIQITGTDFPDIPSPSGFDVVYGNDFPGHSNPVNG